MREQYYGMGEIHKTLVVGFIRKLSLSFGSKKSSTSDANVKNAIFAASSIPFRPVYCANTIVSKRFCRIRNFGV